MAVTVIYDGVASELADAISRGDDLWIGLNALARSTGWTLKPEGACRGESCVAIPAGRESEFTDRNTGRFNLAALARLIGQPIVHDDVAAVWLFGESAQARRDALLSLHAPDFTLPDLDGRRHSLSDYRGKKILLLSWASW